MARGTLSFAFRISPDGQDPFEVTATSRDLSKWERLGMDARVKKMRSVGSFVDDMQLSWIEEIAHLTALRHGKFDDNLNTFRETCDVDLLNPDEDEDGSADPTQSGR